MHTKRASWRRWKLFLIEKLDKVLVYWVDSNK
jgi:hypothetical protein